MNNSEHEEGRPIGSLYIWDDLEKRGFPVTEDVMVLPIDALTWEERQVLAAGDSEAISEMVKREGNTLEEFVMMGATVFMKLMHALYEDSTPEKKEAMKTMILGVMRDLRKDFESDSD